MDLFELAAKLTLDKSDYENGLSEGEDEAKTFGSKLKGALGTAGKIGGAAIGVVATGVTAMSTALVNGVSDVASYGDNIDKMSQKMGISAEAYQEWDAILQHSGTSIESLKPSMKTLANAAQNGSDAFEQLGLSVEDVQSMSQEDLFATVIGRLQDMEEGTERTAIASKLLGRGATELGALLNTSSTETEEMRKRVHELGGVMSDEAVKDAAAFQDQLQDMQTGFQSLGRNMLSEFMPALTTVMGGLTDIFTGDYEEGTEKISEGIQNIVDNISQKAPEIFALGGSILETLAKSIIDNLPTLLSAATQVIMQLSQDFITELPTILQVGLDIILQLAQGIVDSLPELIPTIIDVILEIVDVLTNPDNLLTLIDASIQIIIAIAEGLIKALPKLIEKVPVIIENLLTALVQAAPKLAEAGVKLLVSLVKNLPKIITEIVKAIPKIIKAMVNAFKEGRKKMIDVGKNLIKGLWEGIKNVKKWITDKVKGFMDGIVGGIKSFFGIKSPSRLFRDQIGKNLALGLGLGFTDEMDKVTKDMEDSLPSTLDADIGVNGNLFDSMLESIENGKNKLHVAMADIISNPAQSTSGVSNNGLYAEGGFGHTITINVQGAPGQDVNELANIISRKLDNQLRRTEKAWA